MILLKAGKNINIGDLNIFFEQTTEVGRGEIHVHAKLYGYANFAAGHTYLIAANG